MRLWKKVKLFSFVSLKINNKVDCFSYISYSVSIAIYNTDNVVFEGYYAKARCAVHLMWPC